MSTIQKTLIATSDPLSLLHKNGAILYNENDPDDDPQKSFEVHQKMWDKSKSALLLRFKSSMDVHLVGGIDGTTWATKMNVEGDFFENTCQLTITDDTFEAGKIMGLDGEFEFYIEVDKKSIHWFHTSWDSIYKKKISSSRWDLLYTLYTIAQFLLEKGADLPVLDILSDLLPGNVGHNGYFDKESGIMDNEGKITVKPSMIGDIDFEDLLVSIGADGLEALEIELPVLIPLTWLGELAFKLADEILGPKLTFGVSVGFGSPVDITLTGLRMNDSLYQSLEFDGDTVLGMAANEQAQEPITSVGLEFKAIPRDSIDLGFFASISWLKIFSKETRKTWDIYKETHNGTKFEDIKIEVTMSNDVGSTDTDTMYVNANYDDLEQEAEPTSMFAPESGATTSNLSEI